MLMLFMHLTSCDNSTAQQKKNNSGKVTDTKSTNSNDLIAPDFSLADLEDNTITLEQMRGKVVLLISGELGEPRQKRKSLIL